MSFSSQNLLDMSEALATGVDSVAEIDWVLPSPMKFSGKAAFFAAYDADNDTKTEIETTLVRAARIRYLNFQLLGDPDLDRQIDNPVIALNFECAIFHEATAERLDETDPQDDFDKRIRKTNLEHITAVWGVIGEFQGVNPIPALSAFPDAFTVMPLQDGFTAEDVECEFITGVKGDQTKLQLQVRVQLPC